MKACVFSFFFFWVKVDGYYKNISFRNNFRNFLQKKEKEKEKVLICFFLLLFFFLQFIIFFIKVVLKLS